jgi:hypothetical protein
MLRVTPVPAGQRTEAGAKVGRAHLQYYVGLELFADLVDVIIISQA